MLQPSKRHKEITDEIYSDFCESGGLDNHPFQDAWDSYQEKHGNIVVGSDLENLIYQAMLYAVQVGVDDYCSLSDLSKKG